MAPICSAISSVARAVWPASDLTSEATTAKPRPASPARAASIVALSASRLVWPAIAWMSPITSPMRVAAPPSSVMVWAVRRASATARPATSVDFAAWPAISPIEAASSSTELAAAVTFCEAALTRLSAVRDFRGHRVGGAVELGRGHFEPLRRAAQLAERLLDRMLRNARDRARRRSRCAAPSRAPDFGLRPTVSRSRSIMLSRNTITVRAMAPISSDVACRGNLRRRVAVGQPLHHVGQAVERARDAAADQPAEAQADQHGGEADADDDGAGALSATPSSAAARGVGVALGRAR